jgi:hypothetical protein
MRRTAASKVGSSFWGEGFVMGAQPQPLTSVVKKKNPHYFFGLMLPIKKREDLGWIVLNILNEHSLTDSHWASMLVDLLHADPVTGERYLSGAFRSGGAAGSPACCCPNAPITR